MTKLTRWREVGIAAALSITLMATAIVLTATTSPVSASSDAPASWCAAAEGWRDITPEEAASAASVCRKPLGDWWQVKCRLLTGGTTDSFTSRHHDAAGQADECLRDFAAWLSPDRTAEEASHLTEADRAAAAALGEESLAYIGSLIYTDALVAALVAEQERTAKQEVVLPDISDCAAPRNSYRHYDIRECHKQAGSSADSQHVGWIRPCSRYRAEYSNLKNADIRIHLIEGDDLWSSIDSLLSRFASEVLKQCRD